jgi:hypothetical protein
VLLQFEAAAIPEQRILARNTRIDGAEHIARIAAQDGSANACGCMSRAAAR